MKRILSFIFILLYALSVNAADTYTLDPTHTYASWQVSHFGFSSPSGKWMAKGTLEIDKDKPQNSKLNVTINMADLATGLAELDEHLKGDLFFDVKKFPTATFVSNKVVMTGKNSAKVTGTLTVHGVSKPVTLNVTLNKMGVNLLSDKMTMGFSANTQLNRSDFGINTLLPGVGDKVIIHIEAEAFKA